MKYRVISFGLGPIGALVAKVALERKDQIEIIGAVDTNPSFVGKDLSEILNLSNNTGIRISKSAIGLYKDADIVLHATSSFLGAAMPQFIDIAEKGVDIVTTNEELSYPWFAHNEEAAKLDNLARERNVSILATGVNPGFAMDTLAITLSGVCTSVKKVRAIRILDASKRRVPFQRKVGIGLSASEFEENVRTGKFGHIGLPESIAMVCNALNLRVERIEQKVEPKIATSDLQTEHFGLVEKGKVIGLVQDAVGYSKETAIAEYHIEMYAAAKDTRDEIELIGEPTIALKIPGGTPGDIATAAIIVNSIPRVIDAHPGLLTVKDLRPATSILRI